MLEVTGNVCNTIIIIIIIFIISNKFAKEKLVLTLKMRSLKSCPEL